MTNPIRVLFIEDDVEDYQFIRGMFAAIPRGSYQLDWAATYDDALTQIRQKVHDLYLVDYVLGGSSDGLQLIREAFPDGCDRPVILLTARGSEDIDDAALKLGVVEYFDKMDLRVSLLERTIRYAINSKRIEAELRDSESRLRTLIESAPDFICLLDTDMRVQQVNPSIVRESGYSDTELIGQTFTSFLSPTSQLRVATVFSSLLETGHCRQEIEFCRKDGTIQVMDCSGATTDAQGRAGVVIIMRDITERKRTEEATERALRREKELNEMKSRFVSMVSHEFRSPMAAIRLWAEMLRDFRQNMDEAAANTKLTAIITQIDHMTILVNDVLSLSRIETGQVEFRPVRLDLVTFCRQIAEEIADRYRQSHQLLCELPATQIVAQADTTLMRQMIVNLLENAFKYSPQGGTVRLKIATNHHKAVISITDSGIGIPDAEQKYLFTPFYRATNVNAVTGTGLGLAIVKQAAELHGGCIRVESQMNAGSTFYLSLPCDT